MDIEMAVHSIAMPFVMMCVHKHSLGACGFKDMQPEAFMRAHMHLLLRGFQGPVAPGVGHLTGHKAT
jgi:TetR/AcrR family transcriptional regulator